MEPRVKASLKLLETKPKVDELVYAMAEEAKPWVKCKIKNVYHKSIGGKPTTIFKLINLANNQVFSCFKYAVARIQNHGIDLRVPKRVIAGHSENNLLPGIIAQDPDVNYNKNRFMVMLDDGTCEYFKADQIFPIFYQSRVPWRDQKQLGSRNNHLDDELNHYFRNYPKKLIAAVKIGDKITITRNGMIVPAYVINVDNDVMRVIYSDRTQESIYRGCPRLMKDASIVSRLLGNLLCLEKLYPLLLVRIKQYHEASSTALGDDYLRFVENWETKVKVCNAPTARKSTATQAKKLPRMRVKLDEEPVFDDRELLPYLHELVVPEMESHKCHPGCLISRNKRTEANVIDIVDEFRDTCDLKVPLLFGWRRQLVKVFSRNGRTTNTQYIYVAPCGRILKKIYDIRRYIISTKSKFDVDYFTFDKEVSLNRTLGERNAFHFEKNFALEKATGKPLENKFISLMNPVNEEHLPADFEYRNETFPHPMLKAKGFSFNTEFKSGCDCEDDCNSRASCACHRLNEQAAGAIAHNRGHIDLKCQYKEKRLYQQVSTGIFECNKFCKCSSKCPNRVVQNGIRIRMQVRKTVDKGWGVFVLDDVPKGSFICTYSAELLDDADQYGDSDMYYADLDYITVVENQKLALDSDHEHSDEGVVSDEDIYEIGVIKSKSKKRPLLHTISETSSSEDSMPAHEEFLPKMAQERYPKRSKPVESRNNQRNNEARPQFRKIHSILNESQDYTLDARTQGNIGRFFNHSCDPNSHVQNVFIDTHDLRFPVVAFFTKRALKADDEINWHYNYKIDSIAGRQITCNCGASNCAGRIL